MLYNKKETQLPTKHSTRQSTPTGATSDEISNKRVFELFDEGNDVETELKKHLHLFAELANYYNRKFVSVEIKDGTEVNAESIKSHLLEAMYGASEICAIKVSGFYFWDNLKCDI